MQRGPDRGAHDRLDCASELILSAPSQPPDEEAPLHQHVFPLLVRLNFMNEASSADKYGRAAPARMTARTRGAETKKALLAAAKQLLDERGYAGASVRELAALSGVNVAAVNYHFGSRENLLNEAILESFVEWADRVGKQGPPDPNAEPLQQLATRARPMVDGIPAMQQEFVVALEAIMQSRRSPELQARLAEHYSNLRQLAITGMAATERGSELPRRFLEVVASYMIAVLDGLQLQALVDPDAIPTGDELAALYEGLAAAAKATGSLADTGPDADKD